MSADARATDEALLEAWRGGDAQAGAALFERYFDRVERFFTRKLGPDNEDLIQACFLGLLEGLPRLREVERFDAFLFAIARNTLLKHLRERVRDRARFDPEVTSLVDVQPSPSVALVAHERDKLLLAALRRLPVDTQIMLELHYWEGLKLRHIALVVDKPLGTVKVRMRRGRQALEREMEALAASPEQLKTTLGGLAGWAARLREELGGPVEGEA